jgi:prepilin-type N-terminal cleavage/methylation domain-containing protein
MTVRQSAGAMPDAGFSLVETLVGIAILGVGVLTVVGGMMTSITVGDLDRRQADGQTALRTYAEAVVGDTYTGCTTSYPAAAFSVPTGWTASMTVAYWSTATSTFTSTCGTDSGLQRVTLTVSATDGRGTESLSLGKRAP